VTTDREAFETALGRTPRFVYDNGPRLVLVSVAWVVASLPLVTIGPATLAAYRAILDLRSDANSIDWAGVGGVLRRSGAAATLLSGVPVAFGAVSVTYGLQALRTQSLLAEALALSAGYGALYVALLLMPTFVALARGASDVAAVKAGIRWTARHPTPALTTGLLTLVVLVASVLLMVAFVLLFAGVAFSFQVAMVVETTDHEQDAEDLATGGSAVTA
jgi:hypothetical protein